MTAHDLDPYEPTEEEREKVREIDSLSERLDALTYSYFLIYTMHPDDDIGWIRQGDYYHLAGLLREAAHQHWALGDDMRPEDARGGAFSSSSWRSERAKLEAKIQSLELQVKALEGV